MYVPDDVTLGNPGIFGFIGKAISTVGKALTGEGGAIKVTVGPVSDMGQLHPPTGPAPMPQFQLPGGGSINMATIGLIGGALLLGAMFSGRGRR